ncbi:MAG: universal stress protein [Bacteroidetes bacterium]|nr:universal stress protein [Bacteroidota bacterium]
MKTIFFPTDFSVNANHALKFATSIAEAADCKLVLFHAHKPLIGSYNSIPGLVAEENADATNENIKKLNALSKKLDTLQIVESVAVGDTIEEILRGAQNCNADLIVMGTHGASGLRKVLFGSNTAKVIAKSELPVLAVPQGFHLQEIKTILYSTDLKNPANELKLLLPLAKALNATVQILFIDYGWHENTKVKKAFEKQIKSWTYKNIKVIEQKASIDEPMLNLIKTYVEKHKPDIIAMFPTKQSWFEKFLFGSKTEELAYQLNVPLLSIRKSTVKSN